MIITSLFFFKQQSLIPSLSFYLDLVFSIFKNQSSRLQISILHFNENSDREHATLQDGTERVNIAFPKYKKGEYTVKKILVKCTYSKY